jgi:hypothetical protein
MAYYARLISTSTALIPILTSHLTRPLLYSSHTAFMHTGKKRNRRRQHATCRPFPVATSSERGSSVVVALHHEPYLQYALSSTLERQSNRLTSVARLALNTELEFSFDRSSHTAQYATGSGTTTVLRTVDVRCITAYCYRNTNAHEA